jgi:hypothetical protein
MSGQLNQGRLMNYLTKGKDIANLLEAVTNLITYHPLLPQKIPQVA